MPLGLNESPIGLQDPTAPTSEVGLPQDETVQPSTPSLRPKYPFPVWVEEVRKAYPDLNRSDATQLYINRYGPPPEEEMPDAESYGEAIKATNPGLDETDTHALYNQTVGVARQAYDAKNPKQGEDDFFRGIKEALKQQPELAHGVSALAAASGENVFGSGGAFTSWKESALNSYKEWAQEVASTSQPNDSFTHAWKQASENGNPGALVDFAQRSLGYVTGQIGVVLSVGALASLAGGPVSGVTAALATAGSGGAARTGVRAAIGKAVEGLIEREGAKLAGKGLAAEELRRQATINASKYLASRAALAPYETFMEAGEIGGESVKQATEEGRNLSGGELARVLGASVLAGAIGAAEDIYGLKVLRGSSKVNGILDTAPGKLGRVARGAAQGTVLGTAGAVTEGLQTGVEQVGMGQDPTTDASIREQVDAMGVGFVGAGAIGAAGGAVQSPDSIASQAGIPPNAASGAPTGTPSTPGEQKRQALQLEVEKLKALSHRTKDEAQAADLETKGIAGEVGVFDPNVGLDQAISSAEQSGEPFDVHQVLTEAMIDQSLDPEYQQALLEEQQAQETMPTESAPSATTEPLPPVDLPTTENSLGAFEGQLAEPQAATPIEAPVEPPAAMAPVTQPAQEVPATVGEKAVEATPPVTAAVEQAPQPKQSASIEAQSKIAAPTQDVGGGETGPSQKRGEVGMSLEAGESVSTSSGRSTTPFPKLSFGTNRKTQGTVKQVDKWLLGNALAEAQARGDDFNSPQFQQALTEKTIPQATKDAAEEYLFGEQPSVVKPITKPLSPAMSPPAPIAPKTGLAGERERLLAKKAARMIPNPTPTDLVKEPRSALPDEQNAEILSRASKAQADIELGAEPGPSLIEFLRSKGGVQDPGGDLRQLEIDRENKPFTNRLVKDKGMNLDDAAEAAAEAGFIEFRDINLLLDKLDEESRGIGQTHPDWYKTVTTGKRKLTAQQVEDALAKIVRDKGEDVGRPVEIVKDAILQDKDFATSHYAPRSAREAQMVKDFVRKERGEEGIQEEAPDFRLTPVSQRKEKAKVEADPELFGKGEGLEIGNKPIIGREVSLEEAPLFSKTAQEEDVEQTGMFGEGEETPSLLTPYPSKLKGETVKVPQAEGSTEMVDANAQQALEKLDTEKAQLERLLKCLKK